ncbi:Nup93/Nic96-domain-containing protein [Dendryphion nanum]|uniref:Nup93/Nic96-domain-containing protein n=1 Tax=Dendryphion nanum TaxID=256645 RepID=A0A9P9EJU4_9PLEO|nr:Nup93/Nic96-domain-containing protein [Dendryphion nanum]
MSSLFGRPLGSAPPPTGGTSAPQPLFGSNTTSSAAPASNTLFNIGGASSTAPAATSQPQTTGGFSGFSFSKAATPATTGGLGAGLTSTPLQSQPTAFSSLFPASAQAGAQSTAANPSGFQQTAGVLSTSNAPPQLPGLSQSQSNAGDGRTARFDHLLEKGRKRAGENGFAGLEELPTLQLGLSDIARKVRNLGAGGPSADLAQDRAAHYLLSASGVKVGSTMRDLNTFSTQNGIGPAGATGNTLDTDVDSYLSNIHSQSTLSLIQEGLEQSKRDFDTFLEEKVQIEWEAQRKRIYEHFGLGRQSEELAASQSTFGGTARGAFGRSTRNGRSVGPNGASVNGASFSASQGPVIGSVMSPYQKRALNAADPSDKSGMSGQVGPEDRFVRDKQEKFMEKVKELNVARQSENAYPILKAFTDVEAYAPAENTEHFTNAYDALTFIAQESGNLHEQSRHQGARARKFMEMYTDDSPNSPNSINMRKQILNGSRAHLEKKFFNEVENAVRKHGREAQVGGVPSVINRIRGFIRVKMAFKELGTDTEQFQRIGGDGEEYPWVIIFFLLRAGFTVDAAEYVKEKRTFFQNNDRNFAAAITHFANDQDRRLTPDLQQKINNSYAQRARISPTNDPYRMACYKIVGRCEMTRRNLEPLQQSLDDWIWLQFNLAREGNRAEENAGEMFGLEELQNDIHQIGQRHFQTGSSETAGTYGVFFYLATLAGMFESAVNFLYSHNYVSAIHFAIALDYYGLLRVSDWETAGNEILTFTPGAREEQQRPQLNFVTLVGHYTMDFRAGRADAAAEYLVLISLNSDLPGEIGQKQAEYCYKALRELVLETREFATLLGDVKADGQSTQGLILQRSKLIGLGDDDAFVKSITQEAAKMADDNGRTNDAVLLSHLAREHDNVVKILNRALSEALSVDLGQEPLRLEPLRQRLPGAEVQGTVLPSSNLSMLGTDDPIELARRVIDLYDQNALWWQSVSQNARDTLGVLYCLNGAKKSIEASRYMEALDQIQAVNILPLQSRGNLSAIRAAANNFAIYPSEIARNIGNVLLWSIGCCSRHREILLSGQYEDPTRRALADELLQKAKDLMVFAGLIRYKLPPRVFETLAKEGQDFGVV